MKKKIVATGLGIGLIAGAGAGLILQSSGLAGASPATSSISIAAPGTSTDTDGSTGTDGEAAHRADHVARLTEALQPLVDEGTITADQMTAVIEALEAARPEGGRMEGGRHGGMGGGRHGGMGDEMGPGMHGGGMHGGRGPGGGPGLDAAADVLGLDLAELMTQLRDGATIAEIAEAAGIDLQGVVDAMLAEVKTHLDERVASGDLTQEEADARLADITAKIDDVVQNGRPGRGMHAGSVDDAGA